MTAHGDDELHFWSFIDHAIARAHQELPGIDPLAMRLVLTLHRAANMLVYDLESTVHRPRGWSWPGFRVLFVIWLAEPVEARKVAELSGMSRAAVSALVGTLERDGLVTKERAPYDGRAILLGLTPQGREAIAEAFRVHNARERSWAGALSPDEQQLLIGLLEKISAHAADIGARQRS
ncbi:MarR family winged helix-turn-helix transcriptional regulator [Streptomyces sp. NBC_00829]|uniref:MarR family winged helix-turn-helix transcriptional regulator n=1 Tax=Streptomyces sp. NBC_00829 TaxID=2903679 RepID=UPI003868CE12|nr:MarR family transcriptional regulator [Streptomyces sp. NBC_00829]